jgi:Rrf2 family protein
MQVTRASDYAVRVMIQLASLPAGERQSLSELARATGVPESFLAKILRSLSRAGLIVSHRGKSGGFELLAPGQQSSMRDIIEAIDGPVLLNVCLQPGESCDQKQHCLPHRAWQKAQQAMLAVLETTMIADLAAQCTQPQFLRAIK